MKNEGGVRPLAAQKKQVYGAIEPGGCPFTVGMVFALHCRAGVHARRTDHFKNNFIMFGGAAPAGTFRSATAEGGS